MKSFFNNGRVHFKKAKAVRLKLFPFNNWVLFTLLLVGITLPNVRLLRAFHTYLGPFQARDAPVHKESRFVKPPFWRDGSLGDESPRPLTYREANYRVFMSSTSDDNSDGLGHRFTMVNFDLNVAHALGVGYLHRRSGYGSLTPEDDKLAVERVMGWESYPDLRDEFLERECEVEYMSGHCERTTQNAPICKKLKKGSMFKHIVKIPPYLTDCIYEKKYNRSKCTKQLVDFAKRNDKARTLFQMIPSMCSQEYRDGFFDYTAGWMRQRYWKYHRYNTTFSLDTEGKKNRVLPFEEGRIQVAVHIRRGDFLHFTHRHMVPDWAYAAVIGEVKIVLDFLMQRNVGVDVAIYSEGVPKKGGIMIAKHNVSRMDPTYVTHEGKHVKDTETGSHFGKLIEKHIGQGKRPDVRVHPFIASDTLAAVHAMSCADVFIGSMSGMSTHLVRHLGRGVILLPSTKHTGNMPQELQLRYDDGDLKSPLVRSDLKISLRKLFPNEVVYQG